MHPSCINGITVSVRGRAMYLVKGLVLESRALCNLSLSFGKCPRHLYRDISLLYLFRIGFKVQRENNQ